MLFNVNPAVKGAIKQKRFILSLHRKKIFRNRARIEETTKATKLFLFYSYFHQISHFIFHSIKFLYSDEI